MGVKTKVFYEKFGRHKLIAVYEVNDQGEKVDGEEKTKPQVKMGVKKVKAILDHVDEFRKFGEGENA